MSWSEQELSAYIDGQLSEARRLALEQALQHDAALRARLSQLQQTVTLVRSAPLAESPRNFLLTPSQVTARERPQQRLAQRWYPITRLATALTAMIFVVTLGLQAFPPMMASMPALSTGGEPVAMVPAGTQEPTEGGAKIMVAPETPAPYPAVGTPEVMRSLQATAPVTQEVPVLTVPGLGDVAFEEPAATPPETGPAPENWLVAFTAALAGLTVMFGAVTWWLGRQR